ncbi:MAG TPA: nucleotide exchange factor GrpE, partial [Candidatus Cloacimonas sp.]|nr:nucleotide exchange factor GrpE [Candidatus Cloacimonas sp.]
MAKNKIENAKDVKEVKEKKEFKQEQEKEKKKKTEVSIEEQNKKLQEEIEKLKQEVEKLNERRIRTAAEFENFRRRSNSEKSNWIKNATERLTLEICEVLDNFERALAPEKEFEDIASFRKGIELIYQQLQNILNREGVQKIEAVGKDFDPNYHDALAHIPSELEENKVAAVIQNGYKMNDKVI